MFRFFKTEDFVKSLEKLDSATQQRIKGKLLFFTKTENPLYFAKKLKEEKDLFRFRVGNYRILFRIVDNSRIDLLLVEHRKDIYENL